ncbi:trifunctional serine/threonine-protein kinase/ATP-binding protein/sensor histidine kinase [Variovorax saccharolyticus]|uniref:trifunctional serine/threonine-protein kinase/ATP-binding protein/sensor histidine kinase n=1 Tax=Variovorax saccharolyticus TaxID=3053516 RepID=UPI002577110B|nr:AAA family ATPase [Variovorax sp. J31P216]MDM0025237.1 AAA family ATPase [Variovorax sp. J31P216]
MNAVGRDSDNGRPEVLWEDADRAFCRLVGDGADGDRHAFMPLASGAGHSNQVQILRLAHEYELKDHLDATWALRPVELVREAGRTMLVVDFAGGAPLDRLVHQAMETGRFLRIATAMSAALGRLHGRGLIHKDLKPANVIVDSTTERVWLTGFGIASRLPRERQAPEPPEFIAGTLAYMAPEQTGRVNRSIDSRSDLYALGVTFYEMLTGHLPFTATDPMEWVHAHIARQPTSPSERSTSVPAAVSGIVMKLLAKTVEERYQSAAGVERDLRRCLSEWNTQGRVDDFSPGDHDAPDRLLIPEKLYGRESEVASLLAAFDRIVAGGGPELVLVSGYSGIGKSAVVNELQRPLVPPRGLFAAGKFDQYKRDIPYATLAQALQGLIRPLLAKDEDELGRWREALREALDPHGLLMVELVPELKHIIGEQPPVPELAAQDAQGRFQLVLRRFIGAFARPEHPLALFLDDLQWLDSATLDLLENLLTSTDVKDLLLIGAYRDNEVSPTHPLVRKLDAIRQAGAAMQEIVLAPLDRNHLGHLLADSFRCELVRVGLLAQLIHEKTSGNPFFAIQFISGLADEGLLAFDYDEGQWSWDLDLIHAKGYTDNVVELMLGKLNRLPSATRKTLHQFACLGSSAGFDVLRMACQESIDELHDHLWEAERAGLIFRSNDGYRFLHDRVQEAAYLLVPRDMRAATHLRLGTLLAEHTPAEKREEAIFEIVNQLNRGAHLIDSPAERVRVANLNLIAGRRARLSTAFESALKYLHAGLGLLTQESWERNYELMFSIEYLVAECELLTGDLVAAEVRLARLVQRTSTRHDHIAATRLRIALYTTWDKSDQGLAVFLDWLRRDGTVWSIHPTREDAMREYERTQALLGGRQIEDLLDLPLITDAEVLDTFDVFLEAALPSFYFDEHLASLVVCRLVGLGLEHGNCDAACFGYVWMAFFSGPRFGNYKDGFRFGQLGFDLVEKRGLVRYQARTYLCVGSLVIPWTQHPASGLELVRRAFDVAHRNGEIAFAGYSLERSVTIRLAAGDHLAEVQKEAEDGLAFSIKAQMGLVHATCSAQLGLARTLRGSSTRFGLLDHEGYGEREAEQRLASEPNLGLPEFYYWVRKLQARCLAGDHSSAIHAALNAQRLLWRAAANFEAADFHFYAALARAAAWESATPDQKQLHLDALAGHQEQIGLWSEHNPVTFESRAAIIGAEIARIDGRVLDAQDLYEKAIRSAHTHGFVNNEAIANERAGYFYAARGFGKIATTYLRDAHDCYLRWGADGKARQLEQLHPQLQVGKPNPEPGTSIQTTVEHLDLATVMKVSEALSGEIVLEKLIDTLVRTAVEHAGAERGVLILARGDDFRIEAEATIRSDKAQVEIRRANITAADLPGSVFRYTLRTRESVLLHDASGENPFSADDYIREHRARSVLCLPILKQTRMLGMLYLENNLTIGAFTPARMAVLKLLASEAAISMENARLYRDLAEREARIRRLVDANIIGIFFWDLKGRILQANRAFLLMLGYDEEDLSSGRIRWTDLTPPEWREREDQTLVPELKATGRVQPYEKEFFRKDGGRVPVLIGAATFEEDAYQGVAFVLDLTERKRAADDMREVQAELAHANRLATMGQLAASIAHEVNQPIGAARNNAHAALRFLAREPPELAEVTEALECVVSDTYRAGSIVGRIRDQVRKVPPRRESVDLNDAIGNVIALVRGELSKNHVVVETHLAEGLPQIRGDRVQLQQVMLNLILNAIDAMSGVDAEERKLVICTESTPPEGLQLVTVGDSGPGIAPGDLDRVFESFYTTKASGLGIGLPICRSIIDAHGGRLWAGADPPRGATFRFTLPALP